MCSRKAGINQHPQQHFISENLNMNCGSSILTYSCTAVFDVTFQASFFFLHIIVLQSTKTVSNGLHTHIPFLTHARCGMRCLRVCGKHAVTNRLWLCHCGHPWNSGSTCGWDRMNCCIGTRIILFSERNVFKFLKFVSFTVKVLAYWILTSGFSNTH